MSAPLSCCTPCAATETVNVPGKEGDPGTDGLNGLDAVTRLTGDLVIPAEGLTVNVNVENSAWMVIGQFVIVGEGVIPSNAPNGWGHFQVTAIPNATQVTLKFLNYLGDTATAQTLATGATISPAGMIGPAGP